MLTFLDSFQQPTPAQADAFWQQGFRGWAFNVWGWYPDGNAADVWAVSTIQAMLADHPWRLLPIGVPRLDMSGDPVANAAAALQAAAAYGIHGVIGCDTENVSEDNDRLRPYLDGWHAAVRALGDIDVVYRGAHYTPAGAANWLPSWMGVSPPSVLPVGVAAWQWSGGHVINGVDVDRNIAYDTFPMWPLQGPNPQPPPPVVVTPPAPTPPAKGKKMVYYIAKNAAGAGMYYVTAAGKIPLGPAESADIPALLAYVGQTAPLEVSVAMLDLIPNLGS